MADFIRRLEHTFQIAYGRDKMSTETQETLLFGQLQDGLRHDIMQAPAVSGAHNYQELCLATRNEEKRQLELVKRRQYGQQSKPTSSQTHLPSIRCHGCGKFGHIQANCRAKKTESSGKPKSNDTGKSTSASAKSVHASKSGHAPLQGEDNLLSMLYSNSSESDSEVRSVRIRDCGSRLRCVQVNIHGVPVI